MDDKEFQRELAFNQQREDTRYELRVVFKNGHEETWITCHCEVKTDSHNKIWVQDVIESPQNGWDVEFDGAEICFYEFKMVFEPPLEGDSPVETS